MSAVAKSVTPHAGVCIEIKMAVLATPKKNSYILKKGKSEKIMKSKNSHADIAVIEERAAQFTLNNLKEKK